MDYAELYKDDDYVRQELLNARAAFTNPTTTHDQYQMLYKALGLMLLNCSEDLKGSVEVTLYEAEMRERMFFHKTWLARGEIDG